MKANIDILTKKTIRQIKDWIGLPPEERGNYCPFYSGNTTHIAGQKCNICDELFPSSAPHFNRCCPCYLHPVGYVFRKAKEFIKKWEAKRA